MVYAIRNDDHHFQQLDFDIMDLLCYKPNDIPLKKFMSFELENLSLKRWWPTHLEFEFYKPRAKAIKVPDVSVWTGSTLVLSPRASRYLGAKLDQFGERLSFTCEGDRWELFNCQRSIDADPKQTTYHNPDGHQGSVKSLGFSSDSSDAFVFKCPQEGALTPFATDHFKEALEAYELEGVLFDTNLVEFPD